MTDPDELHPETEDDALTDVDELGGDVDILASLPDEGSPLHGDTAYDALEEADELGGDAAILESLPDDDPSPDDGVLEAMLEPLDMEHEGEAAEFGDEAAETVVYSETPDYDVDFLDIDAALASVASLPDVLAEREAAERAAREAAHRREPMYEPAPRRPRYPVQAPPPVTLRRGQPGSVVPALLLIGIGAWLTFAVTAPNAVPLNPSLVLIVVGAAVVVTLFAQWFTMRRWSRGVFFFALLALLIGGTVYAATVFPTAASLLGPLILLMVGVAFWLTGLFSRPTDRRLLLPGALFIVAAVTVLAVSYGALPAAWLAGIAPLWYVVVAVIAILWLLPILFKRRG